LALDCGAYRSVWFGLLPEWHLLQYRQLSPNRQRKPYSNITLPVHVVFRFARACETNVCPTICWLCWCIACVGAVMKQHYKANGIPLTDEDMMDLINEKWKTDGEDRRAAWKAAYVTRLAAAISDSKRVSVNTAVPGAVLKS